MTLHKICILGAGTLGSRVALQSAISGFTVSIFDLKQASLDSAILTMQKILRQLVRGGTLTESQVPEILHRIQPTLDLAEALKGADLVNESVTENVDIKKSLWSEVGKLAESHTWLTTNTSYLLPSQFAEETGSPSRFCSRCVLFKGGGHHAPSWYRSCIDWDPRRIGKEIESSTCNRSERKSRIPIQHDADGPFGCGRQTNYT